MYNHNIRTLRRAQMAVRRSTGNLHLQVIADFVRTHPSELFRNLWLGVIRARDYSRLLSLADDLVSQKYDTAHLHRWAHQLAALVQKYPFPHLDKQATESAWFKFKKFERRCRHMNYLINVRENVWDPGANAMKQMRDWIAYVIGFKPDYSAIFPLCNFGPGASVGVSGDDTHFARKLSGPMTVTPASSTYAFASMKTNFHIMEYLHNDGSTYPSPYDDVIKTDVRLACEARGLVYVDYNKITFVPKTATTYRSIAIEPSLNGFVQKGIDEFLRLRLRRVGLDLRDQDANKKLAYLGSLHSDSDDPYCTIDLSSASDSICTSLVKSLLPPDWFSFLDSNRSKFFMYKGVKYPYHKFTSMGNGFCFPLQTLIFSSVCMTAYSESNQKPDFRVYGDDIIVRRSVFKRVIELIRYLGFLPNPKKTFSHGPFRESCGADFFGGEDVRPIYLDYPLDSIQNLFKFHNSIKERLHYFPVFGKIMLDVRNHVPPDFRFMRARKGQPDTAFEVDSDTFMASKFSYWNPALWCWSWHELLFVPVNDSSSCCGSGGHLLEYIAALRGAKPGQLYTFRRKMKTRVRVVSHDGDGVVNHCLYGRTVRSY